ncbi:MAG: hypothetical protein HUJ75_06875, partial [Parasporobacterium sp.]|nr:hypothetical protein [Parasporobacterium sp.]
MLPMLAATIGELFDAWFYSLDMSVFQFFGSIQSDFMTQVAKVFSDMGTP